MRSSQSIILLYQQDLQQLIPTMSSPASHLNSSDSNEDQIYNVDSTLQSRMPNEGLPLATFYGTKNFPSSDSPVRVLFEGHEWLSKYYLRSMNGPVSIT